VRITMDGNEYDLSTAFNDATMSDWRALISGTFAHEGKARGISDVEQGIRSMMARSRSTDPPNADDELLAIDTVTALLFLARRVSGERPLKYGTVADTVKWSDVAAAFAAAQQDGGADVETDPTQVSATTDSVPAAVE
jgi:hypothetical protein